MGNYCTLNEIKTELGDLPDDYDDMLMAMAGQVKAWIDDYCDRTFESATATRYYDGAQILFIDDLISVTTLKLDEDADGTYECTMATGDYVLYPLNSTPKTYIKISGDSNYGGFASSVRKGVEIVGTWGYGTTIPEPIRRAAIIQTCRLFKRKDTAFENVVSTPELGTVKVYKDLDPEVKLMLRPYIRIPF